MIKFTKEEISLCKQIAEKHKKTIHYGDWYLTKEQVRNCADSKWVANGFSERCIPLWTIFDCLEFLRKRGYRVKLDETEDTVLLRIFNITCYGHKSKKAFYERGNTDLEACLKAVLALLEEKPE